MNSSHYSQNMSEAQMPDPKTGENLSRHGKISEKLKNIQGIEKINIPEKEELIISYGGIIIFWKYLKNNYQFKNGNIWK